VARAAVIFEESMRGHFMKYKDKSTTVSDVQEREEREQEEARRLLQSRRR
jgi:hypothetical protein